MISFVIPVKDEQATLERLCAEILDVVGREHLEAELVFVDDASTDGSWDRIVTLTGRDARVRGVRLRRSSGKAAALSAGFAEVRGEIVFTLDADLQDDPHEIPGFLRNLEQGYDLISGWKKTRHDPWHKVWPSRVFNRMIGALTGLHLHDHVCGFKCCRAEVVREVDLYGEMHRFFAVRAFSQGFKVTEMEVHHRPREHGRSKYGVERFIKGFLDLLTVWFTMRFGWRPMHFFGGIGVILSLLGLLVWLAGRSFWTGAIVVLFGLPWFAAGLLGELRLATAPVRTRQYSVMERVGFNDADRPANTEVPRDG